MAAAASNEPAMWTFLERVLEYLPKNGWVVAAFALGILLIVMGPQYITAISSALREGRRCNAEIGRKQALLRSQLAKRLAPRRRKTSVEKNK